MMKSILKAIKILITSPWKFVDELVELYGSWIPDYTYLQLGIVLAWENGQT